MQENPLENYCPLVRQDLVFEQLDGEAILYDPSSGAVHRLSVVGLVVWEACDGTNTIKELAQVVTERFDILHLEACREIARTVSHLDVLGLLVPTARPDVAIDAVGSASSVDQVTESPADFHARTEQAKAVVDPTYLRPPSRVGLSRRAMLTRSTTKMLLAPPIISTFFATGAYASGPSASAAFDGAGNKNVGYSCTVDTDCSGNDPEQNTLCWEATKTCCIKKQKTGCVTDADCCPDALSGCVAGTCAP